MNRITGYYDVKPRADIDEPIYPAPRIYYRDKRAELWMFAWGVMVGLAATVVAKHVTTLAAAVVRCL